MLVLVVVAGLAALTVLTVQSSQAAAAASDRYSAARANLDAALQQAHNDGYTDQDLQAVTVREGEIESQSPPLIPSMRASFYDQQAQQLDGLLSSLADQKATALADARSNAAAALKDGKDKITADNQLGVDPTQLTPLLQQLTALSAQDAKAKVPRDFHAVQAQAQDVAQKAKVLGDAQAAENQLLAQQGKQMLARAGSAPALRRSISPTLGKARNDASVANYLGLTVVDGSYQQFEHYAALLQSANPDDVGLGAAGAQHYADQIHRNLLSHMPHKTIVVSLQAQEMWVYQDGRLVLDSLVTTGRPQLPTDVGKMHVLFKSSPWTMKSPWPKTSPWWYPDTVVQMAIFFTDTGESLHDAYWEPDGYYGPGSEYTGVASHGCIHVPYSNEQFLYSFVDVGTPVVVFPGDGSPVKNQVSQITVDSQGNPFTGPKGV